MIVSLEDRRDLKLAEGLANRLGRSARKAREGAVNPDAPACSLQFGTNKSGVTSFASNHTIFPLKSSLILPHDIFRATHLKKK